MALIVDGMGLKRQDAAMNTTVLCEPVCIRMTCVIRHNGSIGDGSRQWLLLTLTTVPLHVGHGASSVHYIIHGTAVVCPTNSLLLCPVLLPADLGVVDPVQLVAMHKDKQAAAVDGKSKSNSSSSSNGESTIAGHDSNSKANGSSSSSNGGDTCAERDSYSKADVDSANGVVHSLGRYDPHSDKFVGGSSDGQEMTAEEQLNIKRPGSMTAKGAEWGLLQLDLSFAWQLQDKPVEDVPKMLEQAAAVVK